MFMRNIQNRWRALPHLNAMKKLRIVNQFIGQKIGYRTSTSESDEFVNLQQQFEDIVKFYSKFIEKVEEMLIPNYASRNMIKLNNTIGFQKDNKELKYTQPEGFMGSMLQNFTNCTNQCLSVTSKTMSTKFVQIAEAKEKFETQVRLNIISPIDNIKINQLTPIKKLLKKVELHRLKYDSVKNNDDVQKCDYEKQKYMEVELDCKKNLEGFLVAFQSQHLRFMHTFDQLVMDLYETCLQIMKKESYNLRLAQSFNTKCQISDVFNAYDSLPIHMDKSASDVQENIQVFQTRQPTVLKGEVLYDFDAREDDELTVKEGDVVEMINKVDDDWWMCKKNGKNGIVPSSFINIQ